jgi:4'-phosphopantetheinyl transferase
VNIESTNRPASASDLQQTASDPWKIAPPKLELGSSQVHVWRASLNRMSPRLQSLTQILCADERARAERLRFPLDRERFITAHALVRTVLSGYLDRPPADLKFLKDAHGKPRLDNASRTIDLRFSLSHSHDIVLLALAEGREVGVDIERERPDLDILGIAERFFATEEFRVLRDLPEGARQSAFFQLWTRKEAVLKATGKGLTGGLKQVHAFSTGQDPVRRIDLPSAAGPIHVCVEDLPVDTAYAAALATEGSQCTRRLWSVRHTYESVHGTRSSTGQG